MKQVEACPACHTIRSASEHVCECGYDFQTATAGKGCSGVSAVVIPMEALNGPVETVGCSERPKSFVVVSYVYGFGWILGAIATLVVGAVQISVIVSKYNQVGRPEFFGRIVGAVGGLLALEAAILYCAISLLRLRCNKFVLGFLYAFCVLDGLRVISHGLIPFEIVVWLLLGLWPTLYLQFKLKTQQGTHRGKDGRE